MTLKSTFTFINKYQLVKSQNNSIVNVADPVENYKQLIASNTIFDDNIYKPNDTI